jgi:hypothetical protein
MRGDLGAILTTALHQDAAQRYPSVEQFAADIERYLAGRPVHVCGTSPWYRLQKSMLRGCNASVATAALLGALAGVVGGAAWIDSADPQVAPPAPDRLASAARACPHRGGRCVEREGSKLEP